MKVLSAEQIYKADQITIANQQISSLDLMERAATRVFWALDAILEDSLSTIHIFCGVGNNGGDGLVVGRLLLNQGYRVITYVVNYSDKRSRDFLHNYDRIKSENKTWPILIKSEKDFPEIGEEDVVVDAIFGIGLNRSPEGWVKKLIQHLNASDVLRISIDIPSGLFANAPIEDKEAVFKSDLTLTFQTPKLAFYMPETSAFVGVFEVLDIGLDAEFIAEIDPLAQTITKEDAQNLYIPRERTGHKGTYGHTLIVGGSYGKIGAAVLSTKAALRMGAGLVTSYIPKCGYIILQTTIPEAMVITDKEENYITQIDLEFEPDAIAVGMGMGTNEESVNALKTLFEHYKKPMVIDADALNCISENRELLDLIPEDSILTPHPGELKRLIGEWSDDYEKIEKVKAFSEEYNVIVLVKGANTLIISGDEVYINTTGNPGMGTAGSGDVLSGILAGLLSQGFDSLAAAMFGVYLHGLSGDLAAEELGYDSLIAGDIIDYLSDAYLNLPDSPEDIDIEEDDDEYDEDY